eukprot:Selendium_serpulae@DN3006_c0_g1_i10.p1
MTLGDRRNLDLDIWLDGRHDARRHARPAQILAEVERGAARVAADFAQREIHADGNRSDINSELNEGDSKQPVGPSLKESFLPQSVDSLLSQTFRDSLTHSVITHSVSRLTQSVKMNQLSYLWPMYSALI